MTDDMKEWIPDLGAGGGSLANRLAKAIAADVVAGRLAPGERLPTQRALAQRLGITTGTVNRAYAIAERSGLVSPEVGRGTFVTAPTGPGIHDTSLARESTGTIEMGLNYPPGLEAERKLADGMARLLRRDGAHGLLGLAPYPGRPAHRAAGARWLANFGVVAGADDVLVCTSVQHGLAATLAAVTVPGDTILTEGLTSPGIKTLAAMFRLRLVGVECDAGGLVPDALRDSCRSTGARVLYTIPTLHTPTAVTTSDERRRALAEVVQAEQLTVLEDDPWAFLAGGVVTPLVRLLPERVVHVTSVSKSLAPGLRVGYVVAPPLVRRAITSCLGAMTWAAPLMGELVTEWIDDGTAASIMKQRTRVAAERRQLARDLLGPIVSESALPAYHLWLPLPDPWRADEFVAHAAVLGVSLSSTDTFVPGRSPTPHAIRLCIGTEGDVRRVEEGLRIVARMLESGPAGYSMRH